MENAASLELVDHETRHDNQALWPGRFYSRRLVHESWLRLRPYSFHLAFFVYTAAVLWADAHVGTVPRQCVLGIATAAVLFVATRFSPPEERLQVWILVAVATCVELSSSLGWGVYRYRFGNVPLYVPPGHGLVYLFALHWARTPVMLRYRSLALGVVLFAALCWAALGLTLSPHVGGRVDLLGALLVVPFAWLLRKPSASIYAGAFIATVFLELVGTGFGDWTWAVSAPYVHLPAGNPPSAVAGAYCGMDYITLKVALRLRQPPDLARWASRFRMLAAGRLSQDARPSQEA